MASKIMNVIVVIFTLAILILLMLIINSILSLSDTDAIKRFFTNSTILISNLRKPPSVRSVGKDSSDSFHFEFL